MQNTDEFYLQDSRAYVGNDMLWWARDGKGYTTDLSQARVYSRAEALSQHESRVSDIPWPKAYIDARTRPTVDMQYCQRDKAMQLAGIQLTKPARPIIPVHNCAGCGRFVSDSQRYIANCANCGTDNRP